MAPRREQICSLLTGSSAHTAVPHVTDQLAGDYVTVTSHPQGARDSTSHRPDLGSASRPDRQTGSTVAAVVPRSVEDAVVLLWSPAAAGCRRRRRSVFPPTPASTRLSSHAPEDH